MKELFFLFALLAFALPGVAEDQADSMDEVGLERLLEMKIITATQQEQTAAEATAIVSVLTDEQLQKLGVMNLSEALNYLPGIVVTESYFGYSMVNMRGVLQTHYNNKVLLLINGHPMREVVNGSFHLEIVPIEAIKRIEVIRGPGSALYGTNAFSGIINIITRTGEDPNHNRITAGGGFFGTLEASAAYGDSHEKGNYYLCLNTHQDNGYPFEVEADERGETGTIPYENDLTNFWGSLKIKDLTISAAYFHQKKQKFGIVPVLEYNGPNYYDSGFVDIRWNHSFQENLSLLATLRYDVMKRVFDVGHFPYDGFEGHENADIEMRPEGHMLGSDIQLAYSPRAWMSLLTGITFEQLHSEPYLFHYKDDGSTHGQSPYYRSHDTSDLSFFGQALLKFTERSHVLAGFRYNSNSDSGDSLLPRAGLVIYLGRETYLKSLYSEAYRSPDFFEKYVETYNVLYGQEDLKPEKIRSYDLALVSSLARKVDLSINAFYLDSSDLVTRTPTRKPDEQGTNAAEYINAGGENIWGLESSISLPLGKMASGFLNYSFQEGEDKDTGEKLEFIANHSVCAGLTTSLGYAVEASPVVEYISEQGDVDPYFLAHLTVNMHVSPGVKVSLIGKNIFDQEYHYPEYIRNVIPEIPGGPGRSFYLRFSFLY